MPVWVDNSYLYNDEWTTVTAARDWIINGDHITNATGTVVINSCTATPIYSMNDVERDRAWIQWNTTTATTANIVVDREQLRVQQYQATLAEDRRARDYVERRNNSTRERMRQEALAQEAAMELLENTILSTAERVLLEDRGIIEITGSEGNTYRIYQDGYVGNVGLLDGPLGNCLVKYCAHPDMRDHDGGGYLPRADAWIGQILHLRTDELDFINVANVHNYQPGGIAAHSAMLRAIRDEHENDPARFGQRPLAA